MKVRINNKWYDSNKEPICIQIAENVQHQIANIDRSVAKLGRCDIFPKGWSTKGWSTKDAKKWVN